MFSCVSDEHLVVSIDALDSKHVYPVGFLVLSVDQFVELHVWSGVVRVLVFQIINHLRMKSSKATR